MKINIARESEYIPEWNDNESNDEPIKFFLRDLTTAERDGCISLKVNEKGESVIDPDYQKIFRRGVIRIENLEVNDEKIKTAEMVLKTPGLWNLFLEVAGRILLQNTEGLSKN